MRARVSRRRLFYWSQPVVTDSNGEQLRRVNTARPLMAAAYALPDTETRQPGGIARQGGFLLALPPDHGLQPGDALREALAPDIWYEVTEVRRYPGHTEGVIRKRTAEDAPLWSEVNPHG